MLLHHANLKNYLNGDDNSIIIYVMDFFSVIAIPAMRLIAILELNILKYIIFFPSLWLEHILGRMRVSILNLVSEIISSNGNTLLFWFYFWLWWAIVQLCLHQLVHYKCYFDTYLWFPLSELFTQRKLLNLWKWPAAQCFSIVHMILYIRLLGQLYWNFTSVYL